ncbi:MAG: hypothetical protein QM820_09855 [Minicystis sp.]
MGTAALAIAVGTSGCGGDVTTTMDAGTDGGEIGSSYDPPVPFLNTSGIDKIDLLLMVDNSRSMADKQQVLAATVPDLIRAFVNPPCVDKQGASAPQQPGGPLEPCPAGTKRRFPPVTDMHVGVITSSIGGHGSDACPNSETFSCGGALVNTSNNDHGHLVTRLDACTGGGVPSYQGKGFLAWDPTGKANPPGEGQLGSIAVDPSTGAVTTVTPGVVPSLKDMVLGAGQVGCGYEASLESWYRFLVDPDPYETITVDPQTQRATPQGIDSLLLQQRQDFLRPSSLLAIVGLTDENDCSIKEFGQFYFAAQQRDPSNPNKNFYLPKARSECATNPNDKCCRSCGQDQTGCPTDPNCPGSLDPKTDDVNLRCWDQKRRFGIDFLYPIDRYVTGLTQSIVPNRQGDMVPNPIFSDLDPTDADTTTRDSSMVLLTYIVGVPWQDLARDPTNPAKGVKTANEMAVPDTMGHSTWDYVIGDPSNFVPPLDPHMIEWNAPRTGTSPITGDTLAPPTSAPGMGSDAINGHEYTPGTVNGVQQVADDLQYACIFPLPQARDCGQPGQISCDCTDPQNDNPLCEPVDPSDPSSPRTRQVRAKAYPGIRQLALLKALGSQGIAGSICPVQLDDPSAPTFGYRPAMTRLGDRLVTDLGPACLNRQLATDPLGRVDCAMLEVRNTGQHLDAQACNAFCAQQPGRSGVLAHHLALRGEALADPRALQMAADCVCEIPELQGQKGCNNVSSELAACQCDPTDVPTLDGQTVNGWCYIDTTLNPPLGNPEIVADCPVDQKRLVRFVGAGNPAPGALLMISCRSH